MVLIMIGDIQCYEWVFPISFYFSHLHIDRWQLWVHGLPLGHRNTVDRVDMLIHIAKQYFIWPKSPNTYSNNYKNKETN